jgi:4-oxalocrotonate tautomerase
MPHVIVKLIAGRSERQKTEIAEGVVSAIMAGARCAESSISVSIQDIASDDWTDKVYRPDILAEADTLYKKPGYDPL